MELFSRSWVSNQSAPFDGPISVKMAKAVHAIDRQATAPRPRGRNARALK